MRARAIASIAGLWSTPTARSARGASSSSMRPVPVPRSSRPRIGLSPTSARIAASTRLFGRVQRADRVPVGGAVGEIGRRLLAPRFARRRQPGAVGGERRVGRIEARDQRAGERAAAVGEAEEGPRALALALGEAGLDQQLEMARDARLRLAEDGDELADRQLGFAEQAEEAQPRHLACRLEAGQEGRRNRSSAVRQAARR